MRVTSLVPLALPLLLTRCGASQDLIIGEVLLRGEAGTTGATGTAGAVAGVAGSDATGGVTATAGTSGNGGSGLGGSSDAGGSNAIDAAGAAGDAGAAGAAGAGSVTPPDDCVVGTAPPDGSLRHRYTFDGTGTVVTDSGATVRDGTLVGGTLDGSGALAMTGDQFVDLQPGVISELTDLTVVAWTTWSGGAAWARVFDFGDQEGSGSAIGGHSYIAGMLKTGFLNQAKPGLGAEIKTPGFPTVTLASTEDMKKRPGQVGFVFRGGVSAALYLDGERLAIQATQIKPSDIEDHNSWIGKSQYPHDDPFRGTFDEFRIYDVALDSCQLHTLLIRGPQNP